MGSTAGTIFTFNVFAFLNYYLIIAAEKVSILVIFTTVKSSIEIPSYNN